MNPKLFKTLQWISLGIIGVIIFLAVGMLFGETPAHALPEYAARTGESCATCHVNPGGGGPRTLRGLLWAAQGRPDIVPALENLLIAPGVNDGLELYDIACASCHGASGEGLFGTALAGAGLRESKIRSTIERGRERSGMPSFEGQFTDTQLELLVQFVADLASGRSEPPPASFPLGTTSTGCIQAETSIQGCEGN